MPYIKDIDKWPFPKDITNWKEQPGQRNFMLLAALAQNNSEWFSLWKSLGEKNQQDQSINSLQSKSPLLWIGLNSSNLNK